MDDGGRSRPRHRGRRDRPARPGRGLSRRDRRPTPTPAASTPAPRPSAPAPRPTPPGPGPRPASGAARSTACRSAGRTSSTPPASRPRPDRRCSRAARPTATPRCSPPPTRAGLVCLGKTHMTELAFSGPRAQPGHRDAAQHQRPRACARRLVLGRRGLGRLRPRRGGHRLGHRRLDRACRPPGTTSSGCKTSPRPAAARRRRAALPALRHDRPARPLGRGRGAAARRPRARRRHRPRGRPARRRSGCSRSTTDGARRDASPSPPPPSRAALDRLAARRRHDRDGGASRAADAAFELSPALFAGEAYATWGDGHRGPSRADVPARPRAVPRRRRDLGRRLRARLDASSTRCAPTSRAATAGYDAVLLPTTREPAADRRARCSATTDCFGAENLLALRNTRMANLMGLCALTLPTGVPSCGLTAMAPAGVRGAAAAARRGDRAGARLTRAPASRLDPLRGRFQTAGPATPAGLCCAATRGGSKTPVTRHRCSFPSGSPTCRNTRSRACGGCSTASRRAGRNSPCPSASRATRCRR